uniref:Uncharacterized protein n=1 Tax=Globisporangium ultimum (strain ATCC 200006 / CBS 805.95 / DAOM BR144) TaxID=431595 RepID=K3X0P6_GLOUD
MNVPVASGEQCVLSAMGDCISETEAVKQRQAAWSSESNDFYSSANFTQRLRWVSKRMDSASLSERIGVNNNSLARLLWA